MIALGLAAASAEAKPKLRNASLRFGNSPRVLGEARCYLAVSIENPDPTPATVKLVLTPERQRNLTIYQCILQLPPQFQYNGRFLVSAGTVPEYKLDVYLQGNLIQTENILARLVNRNLGICWSFHSGETGLGAFSGRPSLAERYVNLSLPTTVLPEDWAGFDGVHMVIWGHPRLDGITQLQYDALRRYVARGGALLFAHPQGTLAASQTPLAELLPVTPLQAVRLERLPALQQLGGLPLVAPEGIDYLYAVNRGEGVNLAEHDGMPLLRWRRFGLGYVGCLAVCPGDPLIQGPGDSRNFVALWRSVLGYGGRFSSPGSSPTPALTAAVNSLTGFQIPGRGQMRALVGVYLLAIVLVLGAGIWWRRQPSAWAALGILALVATLAVFAYGERRTANLSSNMAAMLDFAAGDPQLGTAEQLVSLMTKGERSVSIQGLTADRCLRGFSPPVPLAARLAGGAALPARSAIADEPPTPAAGKGAKAPVAAVAGGKGPRAGEAEADEGRDQVMRAPLAITLQHGRQELDNLLLRPMAPQFLSLQYELSRRDQVADWPLVRWTPDGPALESWPLPAGLRPLEAVLVAEAGDFQLNLAGGACSRQPGAGEGRIRAPSPEIAALRRYLRERAQPTPCVAVFCALDEDPAGQIPSQFAPHGRRIWLFPVRQDLRERSVSVPAERLRVLPARRLRDSQGAWAANVTSGEEYECRVLLPPEWQRLQVRRVVVNLVADNRGGNVDFGLRLRQSGDSKGKRDLKPSRVEGSRYLFEDVPGAELADPGDGSFSFVIVTSLRSAISDPIGANNRNSWVVQDLGVAVDGELPPESTGVF